MGTLPPERLSPAALDAALGSLDVPLPVLFGCVASCGCCIDQSAWRATGSSIPPHDVHLFWLFNRAELGARRA